MTAERFLSELFVMINYDVNFPTASLISDDENLQLFIQVKDGSKFRIKVEMADKVSM